MPKTINGWVSLLVGAGMAVMASYMAAVKQPPLWTVLFYAGLGYIALVIKGGGKLS